MAQLPRLKSQAPDTEAGGGHTPATGRVAPTPLLTARQASAYLQVPVSTLAVWRCTGRVHLPFVKLGDRQVRYRPEDLEAFVAGGGEQHSVSSRAPKIPSQSSASGDLSERLSVFLAKHHSLNCERCTRPVKEAEARIVSHLELPSLEGPRDPLDWHCFCATCYGILSKPAGPASTRPPLVAGHLYQGR